MAAPRVRDGPRPRRSFEEWPTRPGHLGGQVTFALSSLLNGVAYGLLLFMLSSGLTLIFSMMSILNFAHAAFYMLGAYFAYQISAAVGFWPGLVIAPLLVGVLGALVERYGLRKAHRFGPVAELLFTFGLSFLAVEAVQLICGKAAVDYRIPSSLQGALFTFHGTSYPPHELRDNESARKEWLEGRSRNYCGRATPSHLAH